MAALAQGQVPRLNSAVGWTAPGVGIVTEVAVKTGLVPDLLFLLLSPFAQVNPCYRETAAIYPLLTAPAAAPWPSGRGR